MYIPEITISGEEIFKIAGFPITNTFFLSLILSLSIFLTLFFTLKSKKIIPGKIQNFFEWILETLYNFVDSVTNDREKTKEIFPIVTTLFVLILFSNIFELVPGIGVIRFLRSPSSDLNFTLALSLTSMLYVNFLAIKKIGPFLYLKKFLNFKSPIFFFVGILEGMTEITRIFSLAIRLFGNLFAGEVLLIVTSFLFAYLLPLPFLGLEILVGLIQAFIFPSLVVIFYVTAIQIGYGEQ